MGKWFIALGLLVVAFISAIIIFTVTGVMDTPTIAMNLASNVSWLEPHVDTYSRGVDIEAWEEAQNSLHEQQINELALRESELVEQQAQIEQQLQLLERRQEEIELQQKALDEQRQSRIQIEHLAEIYTEMDITEASRIMQALEQTQTLEILASMDTRTAANILANFPTELAATLSKGLSSDL